MKKKLVVLLTALALAFSLAGCGGETVTLDPEEITVPRTYEDKIVVNDYQVAVGEQVGLSVWFSDEREELTYEYDSRNIRIEEGKVTGLLAGTTTEVSVTGNKSGLKTAFEVYVDNDVYRSDNAAETEEGWFDEITVEPVAALTDGQRADFPLGIDISTVRQVEAMGGKYYNASGVRQSVYDILRENGVNYVRIRLFVDPYSRVTVVGDDGTETETVIPYGAGNNDLANVTAMAAEAKKAGLNVLLDFHYSDFWAHPGQQVMPKAWADLATADEIAAKIASYTTETLTSMAAAGAKPDMVQVGNEINSGMILQSPGEADTVPAKGNPQYIIGAKSLSSELSGTARSGNLAKYVNAGLHAVKAFDPQILTMVHYAGINTGSSDFIRLFDADSLDIVGLSAYTFFHGRISAIKERLAALSAEFPDLKFMIAETAAPYTFAASEFASHEIGSEENYKYNSYDPTVQGQASTIRDMIEAVASIENGYGVFCWEGCWLPVKGAGWAGELTQATYANQAFFSYDGKALPSLGVFNMVRGN